MTPKIAATEPTGVPGTRLIAFIVALLAAVPALTQDLEPRSYTNIPVGQTFLVVGASRSEGDLSPTPTSVLQDAELTIDTGVVGIAHSFALWGSSAKFDAVAGRVCYEGSAIFQGDFVEGRRCEYADPRVRMVWNFYGAPALELEDFARWDPGLVVGTSLQVGIPWGSYTSRQLINAGTNRWMLKPGLGMSYRFSRIRYDLMASVSFFEDNNDFYRGQTKQQDPLYNVQGHLIYPLQKGRWISLNANWFFGGESEVDGASLGDRMENSRWGVTFSLPLSLQHSLKFYANTGVVTRVGNDFDTYGMAWQYRF